MRFVGRVLGVTAASTALVLSVSAAATAAIVKAPGTSSSEQRAVWDDRAILESALEGEGLVFDILDITGFAQGSSEFECTDCDVAFSGLHESFSLSNPRGNSGSGGGSGWGPWKKAATTPTLAGPKALEPPKTIDDQPGRPHKTAKAGGPSAAVNEPSSLTSETPAPEQTFVSSPPSLCLDECTPPDDSTTGTDTGDNGGDSGGDSGGSSGGTVPEPGSMLLLGTGMMGLGVAVRRRLHR